MGAPLPQPWTGHRSVVPVEASFIEAVRRGAVVEFSTVPAPDAPRIRGRLIASTVGPEFYWHQFDAQGRNTGTREVRTGEVEDLVHGLVAPELVRQEVNLDSIGVLERVRLSSRLAALLSVSGGAPAGGQPFLDSASPMDRARIAADVARKLAELQGAIGLQRARIAGELAALVSSDFVSIYNSSNGTPATKEPTMETTDITMDRNETEARTLLAAGFKNKAEQKRAKDAASRAFERVMRAIRDVHLADRDNPAGEAVYFGMPTYPHEWKPKHADMIRTGLPDAVEHIEAADRIAALAADIKAAPLLPTVAEEKARKERAEMAIRGMNPELHAEFMAQAPALAADFERYVRQTHERLDSAFPDGIPYWVSETGPHRQHRDSITLLRMVSDTVTKRGPSGIRGHDDVHTLVLNEATLVREAESYGQRTALQWFYKTNQKLGDLQSPTLISDRGGDVHVKGERGGKRVELVQQRIINVSALGKPFHQFPSRIYMDGKFVTEEAYFKLFPPAA